MPLLLAPFFSFASGAFAAFAHRGALGARRLRHGRRIVAAFVVLSLWPVVLYFALAETAWSLLYLVEPRAVPSAVLLALSVAGAALASLGYEAGARMTSAPSAQRLALGLGPLCAAALVATVVLGRAEAATPPSGSSAPHAPFAIVALDVLLTAAFAFTFRELGRPAGRT